MTKTQRSMSCAAAGTELGVFGSMAWDFWVNGFVPGPVQAAVCIVTAPLAALALAWAYETYRLARARRREA